MFDVLMAVIVLGAVACALAAKADLSRHCVGGVTS
jgi:hypothetical protein